MEKKQQALFFYRLLNKKDHFPYSGQLELTYRCNLNCIHCYCKGSEDKGTELSTEGWKKIIDEIQKEGCILLCFTGGEPFIRADFLEIYSYAKSKGFFITIFTNGQVLTKNIIDYFIKSPPYSIEITLNGLTQKTYESITQVCGSFQKVIKNINILKDKKIPFILKTNCLKQNKYEIGQIKSFAQQLFINLARNKYRFKYDPMIYPRFNLDNTPTNYRLSFKELVEVIKQDQDIWEEYQENLHSGFPDLRRKRDFLYLCDSWEHNFFITPSGRLKPCFFSNKFSVDLRTTPFKEGFYNIFSKLLNERFKTDSKCKNCRLRPICYHCPARAYLETGDEEAPVTYYCNLAKAKYKEMKQSRLSL